MLVALVSGKMKGGTTMLICSLGITSVGAQQQLNHIEVAIICSKVQCIAKFKAEIIHTCKIRKQKKQR